MRVTLLALGILAAATFAGCAKVTKEQGTKAFHRELHLYFNNLNNEAQLRKDEFRKADVRLGMTTPTGAIYSTYFFDETAFLVRDYKCKVCETKLLMTSPENKYVCPSCGHLPYVEHAAGFNRKESPCKSCLGKDAFDRSSAANVQAMFEFVEDNPNKPMVAKVRYVRRQWAYDTRGVVDISQRVIEKASVDASYLPSDGQVGRSPGYHRLDATFVGEIEFEFRGGELSVKTRRAEEAVRPWKNLKGNQ